MLRKKEITSLIINAIFVKILLTFPRNIVINSANSAWIQIVYNFLIVLLIFAVTSKVYKEKKNIIEVADKKGGKWLRIPTGIITFLVLGVNFLSVLRLFPETILIILLKNTPTNLIMLLFAAAVAFGAYMGIGSISRIQYMFLPIAAVVLVFFLLLLTPYYDISNIMPFLGNGANKIFVNGIQSISLFSDIILINILLPFAQTLNEVKQSGYKAILISGIISVIIIFAYCLLYPYPISMDFIFPVYQMARMVHLSSFFSRFEAIFQFVWSILILLYASAYLYIMCYVWQETFSLKYIRPVIFPVIIICSAAALIPSSIVQTVEIEKLIDKIAYPLAFVIPLIFGFMTKRKKD